MIVNVDNDLQYEYEHISIYIIWNFYYVSHLCFIVIVSTILTIKLDF